MVTAALATLLWAQAGVAAPPAASLPVDLGWQAPGGCPDVEAVRAGIARGLPEAPAGVAPMRADVVVTALDAEHWRATLELRGADWTATRTLRGASCAAVADAAGLVIGLALTSELASREVVVVTPPPSPPPPPPPPLSTPTVGLAVAGDAGTLPTATPGGALALGWRATHARAELRGSLFASRGSSISGVPEAGGSLSLASLAVRACALWGRAASLGPCAAAGVDRLRATGAGPVVTREVTSHAPFLALGLRGETRLSRWVAPFLDVEAEFPLVRARFWVENVGQVHQPAAVSFRGAAGLELRFR
jgi:hypothetical protein